MNLEKYSFTIYLKIKANYETPTWLLRNAICADHRGPGYEVGGISCSCRTSDIVVAMLVPHVLNFKPFIIFDLN